MSITFKPDKAYQDRVTDVLLKALMVDLKDPATGVVVWKSADLVHVMTMIMAMLVADAEVLTTPGQVRVFCEQQAKKLRQMILETQRRNAEHGPAFETVTITGDLH